jgi:hypothetical protein
MSGFGGHGRQTTAKGVHTIVAWTFADASALSAFTPTDGLPVSPADLTSDDLYRCAITLDTHTAWLLISISPPVFHQLGVSGGAAERSFVVGDLTVVGGLTVLTFAHFLGRKAPNISIVDDSGNHQPANWKRIDDDTVQVDLTGFAVGSSPWWAGAS